MFLQPDLRTMAVFPAFSERLAASESQAVAGVRNLDVTGPARSGDRWTLPYGTLLLLTGGLAAGLLIAEAMVRLHAAFDSRFGARMGALDLLAIKIVPSGDFSYRQRPYAR